MGTDRAPSRLTRVCLGSEGCILATKLLLGEVQGRTYVVLHRKDTDVGGGPRGGLGGLGRFGFLHHGHVNINQGLLFGRLSMGPKQRDVPL